MWHSQKPKSLTKRVTWAEYYAKLHFNVCYSRPKAERRWKVPTIRVRNDPRPCRVRRQQRRRCVNFFFFLAAFASIELVECTDFQKEKLQICLKKKTRASKWNVTFIHAEIIEGSKIRVKNDPLMIWCAGFFLPTCESYRKSWRILNRKFNANG